MSKKSANRHITENKNIINKLPNIINPHHNIKGKERKTILINFILNL